ncbi:MAG: ureidoglycolate lyase, partial [Lysobacterales bacterium]
MTDNALTIELLTQAGFAPFGDVIESGERDSFFINNDMAERFHALARVEALGEDAGAIISLVKSKKYEMPRKLDHA